MTFTHENLETFKDSIKALSDDDFFQGLTLNQFIDADAMYAREYIMKNDFLNEEIQRRILVGGPIPQEEESAYKYKIFEIATPVPLWAVVCTFHSEEQASHTTYIYKEEELDKITRKYQRTSKFIYETEDGVTSILVKSMRIFKLESHYTRRPVPLNYEPSPYTN